MMPADLFERRLPSLLDDLAEPHTPGYFDDLMWQTAGTSQRAAWTIRERWIPMIVFARQPVVAQVPWRPIVVLLLLVGALAAGLILAANRPKLPPLTGPAANGLVAFSRDGDIVTYDPRTEGTAVIVTGPEIDSDPIWSQDGTRLLFRRVSPDQPEADVLMVARADGTGLRQITPEPMTGLTASKVSPIFAPALRYAFSPDGRTVVIVATVKGIPALFVANTDTRVVTQLSVPSIPMSAAFDPTGTKLLFVGAQGFDGSFAGLYVIDADGGNLRTVIEPQFDAQIWSRAFWSPDGTRIAYGRREPGYAASDGDRGPAAIQHDLRVHVITADGKHDITVGHEEGAWWEAPTGWSPDGHRLLIERSIQGDAVGAPFKTAIIDVDGGAPDLVPDFISPYDWYAVWSPDGSMILATPGDANGIGLQQQLWDTRTGAARPAPWTATSHPAWQRAAFTEP